MDKERTPEQLAILALEARCTALRLVVGLLLRQSPEALKDLQLVVPHAADLAMQHAVTDDQMAILQAELEQIVEHSQPFPGVRD